MLEHKTKPADKWEFFADLTIKLTENKGHWTRTIIVKVTGDSSLMASHLIQNKSQSFAMTYSVLCGLVPRNDSVSSILS